MTSPFIELFLVISGLIAGLIDSVAGGGGLITLPSISLVTGPGVEAIATNKIVGFTAAFVSFFVYMKNGLQSTRGGWTYALWIGTGAFAGSRFAHLIPPTAFVWILMVTCPMILALIWRRDFLLKLAPHAAGASADDVAMMPSFIISGLVCGLYDGIWGPGGGTLMLLSLLLLVKLPLLPALLISKLANTTSAGVALISFIQLDHVQWPSGLLMAAAAGLGSYLGAEFVSRQAARVFRPVLTVVMLLLLVRVFATFGPHV
ncbi:MAG: sulfite exporter TauE/SafE family protein [Bdellovibrionia bacterium]